MKIILTALLTAALFWAAPAKAAVHTFGPDYQPFSLNVPEGWSSQQVPEGVQLFSPDGQTGYSAMAYPNPRHLKAQALTKAFVRQAGIRKAQIRQVPGKAQKRMVMGEMEGSLVLVTVTAGKKAYVVETIMGKDFAACAGITKSLSVKKPSGSRSDTKPDRQPAKQPRK